MRKKVWSTLLIFMFALLILPDTNKVLAAGQMNTERFDVTITVGEDNILHVKEEVLVDFLVSSKGIVRMIPYSNTQVSASIENVDVPGYAFETYDENNNLCIKIGQADKNIFGRHKYEISYDFKIGQDGDQTQDLLYFNFLPSNWQSDIARASLTVNMPKSFDKSSLEITATQEKIVNLFTTTFSGNTIKAELKKPLKSGNNGATVRLLLPEGYFSSAAPIDTGDKAEDNLNNDVKDNNTEKSDSSVNNSEPAKPANSLNRFIFIGILVIVAGTAIGFVIKAASGRKKPGWGRGRNGYDPMDNQNNNSYH